MTIHARPSFVAFQQVIACASDHAYAVAGELLRQVLAPGEGPQQHAHAALHADR